MRVLAAYGTLAAGCALAVGGCGEQSALEPRSDAARTIETLWWWMFAVACVVIGGAVVLLLIAWLWRSRPGFPLLGEREDVATGVVVLFGIGIPGVALVALFAVANFAALDETEAPNPRTTAMTIEVTGNQFWWEVRYPGTTAVTANEIHIPARTRVNVVARTNDVIHSFWVPQLNRKIDMIPGQANRVLLYADEPGRYRGQCAELCGLAHAQMGMYVYADPPDEFRAWLDRMSGPRQAPATDAARKGERVFMNEACADCHTIRGTPARGEVGPDLTHLASRSTLAALVIPNDREHLGGWITDPQDVKPGNRMPALGLSEREVADLLAYLRSLG
ncbi:MAG TPA: cytochrome c oxidase subunit II [Solirubrobacteraceae bacterium]|nr:cytochrome c oxidase subunit II [Solirubrobacteraceae bacterium]